jgi:2,3-bisphosphoglycerate-independent phosphoglycerate mutase
MGARLKGLMIILDGLGDRPCAELDGRTPLEAAPTPHFDRWVREGMCGMLESLLPGVPVGTHTGTGVLLGLAPSDALDLTRGPVEAAGIGLIADPGDVLMRCNFATLERADSEFRILDRRAGRISTGTDQLAAALRDIRLPPGVQASLHPATQHRAVLRLSGSHVSAAVSATDPGSGAEEQRVLPSRPLVVEDTAAETTAAALNQFTHAAFQRLHNHPVNGARRNRGLPPANGILCRSAGTVPRLRSIIKLLGLKAATVAGESSVLGLSRLLRYSSLTHPSFTALTDTDVEGKLAMAQTALEDHDIVFLHFKATDICAHDHAPEAKRDFISRVDKALEPLRAEPLVIGVSGDHSTDSFSGRHTGDPVPSLLYAPQGRRDRCRFFGEGDCLTGGLGHLPGTAFLSYMLDAMGAMPQPTASFRSYFCIG